MVALDFTAHPLIETDWLAAHLAELDLRVVDTFWEEWETDPARPIAR